MNVSLNRALSLVAVSLVLSCGGDSTGPEQPPVVASPTALALVTAPSTTLETDGALQPAPVIELRDAANKPVAKAGVSITATLTGGTLTGTPTATTKGDGRATFPGILVSALPGSHELRFSAPGLSSASLALTITSGAPAGMTAASAPLQNGTISSAAAEAPAVRLVDANGNPVQGASVPFTVLSGGGHLGAPAAVTDENGLARAMWTLGAAPGINAVRAVMGPDTVLFRAGGASSTVQSITAASRTHQAIVVGQELSEQPAARVLAEGGVPVEGALVVFGGVSGVATLEDSIAVTDASGIARAGHWKVLAVGQHRLTGSSPGTSPASVRFDVTAIRNGGLAVASTWIENRILATGTGVAGPPSVVVTSDGKPQADVLVRFSIAGDGTLGSDSAISDAGGVARLTSWALAPAAGLEVVTASAAGFTPDGVAFHVFAVEALPATMQIAAGDGQSAVILQPLPVDPVVKVTDADGHPIAGFPVRFAPFEGTVSDSFPVTNSSGLATAGHWTMPRGNSSGLTLAVLADQLQGSPIHFHATSLAGPPAAIYPTTTPLDGPAGGSSDLPSILVLDAGSNRLEGVPVTAEVTVGHGTITYPGVTDAQGNWGLTSWILDTVVGVNEISATVAGLPPVKFTSTGFPGAVAKMALNGDGQSAPIYSPVQVSVRLTDRYGNATPREAVQFVSSGDGRTLPGAGLVGTDSNGVARMDWRMGSAEGSYSLTATHGGDPAVSQAFSATATPVTSGFDVDVRFIGTPSTAMQNAVTSAVDRWRAILPNDLAGVTINRAAGEFFDNQPAISETVDDILVYIETSSIDGAGGVLGSAGPLLIRSNGRLPSLGYMQLDAADVAQLASAGTLQDVVLHEFGHILGIGSLWEDRSFVVDSGSPDPRYNGAAGVQGYHDLGGVRSSVPLENTGGPGTADSHWREETFGWELMTGYIGGFDNALTRMTIGSLQDLGYAVSYSPSDPLAIPASGLAQLRTRPRRLLERTLPSPIIVVDQAGREVGRERRPR